MKEPIVLVIEDDPGVAEIITELLSLRNYRVVVQSAGAQALDWARINRPDLALVDLNLPDYSGQQVIEILKREGIVFPFICISGAGDASVIVEMMKLGAKDYIQKGVEFHTLLAPVVAQVLSEVERERRFEESERELRELEAKVRQSQKLESLGVLAKGIAHDFNNILSSIIGYSRLAMADIAPDTLTYANLREVYQAGTRARELVDQIVNFSRGIDTEKVPIDLALAVREIIDEFSRKLPNNVSLEERIGEEPVTLLASPIQIRRVVDSLVENAIQAMLDSGGSLHVGLESHQRLNRGIPGYPLMSEGSRYAVLTVKDSGVGMSSEVQTRVFEPFFTTRGLKGGRGMGLSAAHGIVRSLGGAIEIESAPGKGSTFRVYLPQTARVDFDSRDSNPIVEGGDERILIVDDEESIARMACQILERLGYSVVVAHDGMEALEVFQNRRSEIDLVLTDLRMPQMSGVELAKSIQAIRPEVPILVFTGSTYEAHESDLASYGFAACLPKPITPAELGLFVRQALNDSAARE